jgi:hypothetical protein
MEFVKRYIFEHFQHPTLSVDLRIMVGSILWEYLLPLLINEPSPFMMEHLLVQFFFELLNMPT